MGRWSPYNYAFNNPIMFIDPDGMAPIDNEEDRYTVVEKKESTSTSTHSIVSRFEPDKMPNGKDGPRGTDKIIETITTIKTFAIKVYDKEMDMTFDGVQREESVTTTTAYVNADGAVNKIEKEVATSSSSGALGVFGTYSERSLSGSLTETLSQCDLGYAHNSAVNYVKDKKVNTGFSPSQLNAQAEQKSNGYVSLATGIPGTADGLTGGRVLGSVASKALAYASLFPTLVDIATDYSGRSNTIVYRTKPK